jgi:hypothetical protein
MDTKTFLEAILPTQGLYFLAIMQKGRPGAAHKSFESIAEMADSIERNKDKENIALYHACASFREPFVIDKNGKKEYRVRRNCAYAKSFWLDIDVGPEKAEQRKGYASKRDAATALGKFCTESGFPAPVVIDSGGGIHCYWPLTEDIPISQWRGLANDFERVLQRRGLFVDDSATSDSSRVLRPVGTFNRKQPENPREVKARTPAKPITPAYFEAILQANMDDLGIYSTEEVAALNSDLFAHSYDGPTIPSSGEVIATKCQQIKTLAETQGDVTYEIWRAGLGLAKHCVEGEAIAEKWTVLRHVKHERIDYEREMGTWDMPPPTCAHFAKHNPRGCEGCPHKDKIKSPIVLGFTELDMSAQADENGEVEVEIVTPIASKTAVIPAMPKGYAWVDNKMLCKSIPVPEEERIENVPFCETLLYPIYRVNRDDGKSNLMIRAIFPREGVRDFVIETSALWAPADLGKALAAYQILPTSHPKAGAYLMHYLRDWLENLKQTSDARNTHQQFGWDEDENGFVIGERIYLPSGDVHQIIAGDKIRSKLGTFSTPQGNLTEWVDTIHEVFGAPHELHRQYAIGNAFGCILTPLCSDALYNGIVFAITGGETAKGKTTTALAAMSAFGNPFEMSVGGEKGATLNARYGLMGIHKNLPLLIDEVTHINAEDLSQLCYTVSSGVEKQRMKNSAASGTTLADVARWATSPYVTANTDLHGLLASRGVNSAAEAVRMVEIHIDEHEYTRREVDEMNRKVRTLVKNQGMAGETFIQYVVSNRGEVLDIMERWAKRAASDIEDSKYRHFRSHAECTMAAMEICKKIGVLRFDLEAVYSYTVKLFQRLANDVVTSHQMSPEDALSVMLNDFAAHVIVTDFYKDSRNAQQDRVIGIRDGKVYGRLITGGGNDDAEDLAGRLYISRHYMRQWCLENRTTEVILMNEMKRLGFWVELGKDDKFVLGRGTSLSTGQTKCVCVDYRKLTEIYSPPITKNTVTEPTPQTAPASKVTPMQKRGKS